MPRPTNNGPSVSVVKPTRHIPAPARVGASSVEVHSRLAELRVTGSWSLFETVETFLLEQ